MIIGAGATIENANIGPFTAVGEGVTIVRSRVEHSVILPDSTITDIPRLEDSLIGKRVTVHPEAQRHGSLSLCVGDDCVVELSKG